MYGEKYKPFKGVKYLTKAGKFQVRTWKKRRPLRIPCARKRVSLPTQGVHLTTCLIHPCCMDFFIVTDIYNIFVSTYNRMMYVACEGKPYESMWPCEVLLVFTQFEHAAFFWYYFGLKPFEYYTRTSTPNSSVLSDTYRIFLTYKYVCIYIWIFPMPYLLPEVATACLTVLLFTFWFLHTISVAL